MVPPIYRGGGANLLREEMPVAEVTTAGAMPRASRASATVAVGGAAALADWDKGATE